MVIAGVGKGFVKILRDAENGEAYTYAIALTLAIYSLIVAIILIRQWLRRNKHQSIADLGKRQIGLWISFAFATWGTIEVVMRLTS